MRRKESLDSKEPERLRLWPLLALPDRVRLDGPLTVGNSALPLAPSSIGAGENQELAPRLHGVQFPQHWEIRPGGALSARWLLGLRRQKACGDALGADVEPWGSGINV